MRRFLLGLLTLLAFCGPALAASDKPLVILAGKTQTIPSGDTLNLTLNPLATNISGSTQCVQANSSGVISGTGTACGTGSGSGTVTSVTCGTGLSGGVITTSGTCSLTAPVTVALGGTNATSASGTALDNISGFASTGFLTRTGAGAYSFQSTTNGVTLANIAQIAANTVLGNATASTANIAAQAMPSCSAATSALTWTTSSGFGCNTISGGSGTVTTTGSAASGNLSKFSGATSITNGDLSGDCTTSGTLAITCTKTGGTLFGTFATQNYATPPAIGGTTPAAGSFSTLSATGNLTTNVTGSTQCLHADTSGVVSGTSSDCGAAGGGMTLLSTQAVSGTTTSTIVFSAISQAYKHLKIVVVGATDGSDNIINNIGLLFNGDTTSAHYNGIIEMFGSGSSALSGTNPAGSFGMLALNVPSAVGSNAFFGPGEINIYGYSQTGYNVQVLANGGNTIMSRIGHFMASAWKPTSLAAVTSVTLTALNTTPSTVHFQNGTTAYLYGY